MADLDDFFAKKDRKKSKNVKKFSTADEVAKKLEDNKKQDKPVKKERQGNNQEGDETGAPQHEQDEWKDFEEEKKDYSGLKIGRLSISSTNEGATGNNDNSEIPSGQDESGNEPDKKSGPWKRIEQQQQQVVAPPPPEPIEKPSEPPQKQGGYVAPHLRNQLNQPVQPNRMKSKTAPDIHNEEFFPTLSGSAKPAESQGAWGRRNRNEGMFEEVRHNKAGSLRAAQESKLQSGQGPKLALGNRYGTLSNDS